MEKRVVWSARANKTLAAIYRHVRSQSKSEQTAFRLVWRIQQSTTTLLTFPMAGSFEPLLEDNPKGYRSLVAEKHYKIIYSLKDESSIEIAAVWDCRQNPEKLQQVL